MRPFTTLRPRTRDLLLSVVTGLALLLMFGPWPLGSDLVRDTWWLTPLGATAGSALLYWRRSRPALVAGILAPVFAASLVWHLDAAAPLLFVTWIALYSVPAHARPRAQALVGTLVLLLLGGVLAWAAFGAERGQNGVGISIVLVAAYPLSAWMLGRHQRVRQAYISGLAAEKEALAKQAAAEERAWIARELHDLLAHTMSGMVVLAGGARRIVEKRPAEASLALAEIERAGRHGMAETRSLLDTLRTEENAAAPRPSIRELTTLADRLRAAGLRISLTLDGVPDELPFGVDTAAYRIVQEALTNVLRHAGPGATASVHLVADNGFLLVEVLDDGRGGAGAPSGHGLAGMRERARLLGGEATGGPEPGGGWAVRARLPIPAVTR